MIVCILLSGVCLTLWILFRKEHADMFQKLPQKGNELKILYPVAYGILMFLARHEIRISKKQRKSSIESLNVTKDYKDTETMFNIRRIALSYMVVFVAAVMGLLYELANLDGGVLKDNQIKRPAYGQSNTVQNVIANDEPIELEVSAVEYSAEQVQENFSKAHDFLLQAILGNNESLQEVKGDLNLITYLESYALKVTWLSSDSDTVTIYGQVLNDDFEVEESRQVTLTAMLSYLNYSCNDEIYITIVAPQLSEQEEFLRNLRRYIKKKDQETKQEEYLVLPDMFEEQRIKYEVKKESNTWILILLGIATAIAIFPGMDKDLEGKMKERKMELQMDYSEIVSKLNILMGSGMSVLKAWEKIVKDYEKSRQESIKPKRFAYEEMKQTYYEIQSGLSESQAYASFGKRCNIHEYLKLGALLEQNVKKGAKGLSVMLEEEANLAFEQRKNLARKLGEEAGTKMLIPMILMLAIVMIIVLVPAFASFSL